MIVDMMKNELGRKIIREFIAFRAEMYAYKKIDKKFQ